MSMCNIFCTDMQSTTTTPQPHSTHQAHVTSHTTDVVTINVGGRTFSTTYPTLQQIPGTRLASLSVTSREYIAHEGVYFFDRNPEIFNSVLDFYRTGELHLPKHACGATIRNELEFWQVGTTGISDCCMSCLFKFEDELEVSNNLKRQFEDRESEYTEEELQASKWNRVKNTIWCLMDKPHTSKLAKIYSVIYMSFVTMTCIVFVLSTHRDFRINSDVMIKPNQTLSNHLYKEHGNRKIVHLATTTEILSFVIINYVCTVFFVVELCLRFVACPQRKQFFRTWLNAVDLVIVFCLIGKYIFSLKHSVNSSDATILIFLAMRGAIILRLLRLFRFAKHFTGLKVVYLALKASRKELGLLCMTFLITTSLFGGLIFYAEFWENTSQFDNIPIGMWWAVVTLTTIGYGDVVPTTATGYVVGALCGMCGLLLLSMPIAVIATNFNDYYGQNKIREKQKVRNELVFSKVQRLFENKVSAKQDIFKVGNSVNDVSMVAEDHDNVSDVRPNEPHRKHTTGFKKFVVNSLTTNMN